MGWWACGPGFYWGNGVNNGYWWAGLIGMAVQLIFWIGLVMLGIYLFRRIGRPGVSFGSSVRNNASLDILRERYARGEIDSEEYQRRKQNL
ncbi:MAG: SHOCT domain-containing protein [Desulfitobacteriaceae bacterium]